MSNTFEYTSWYSMKTRCYNKKRADYKHYGGRGITVCDEWKNSFLAFYKDMGPRPTKNHSIDRIDVNGNYEPSNCRWASIIVQRRNQRIRKDNTSGCKGVVWNKINKNWRVNIRIHKKMIEIGSFKNLDDAIKARKDAEKKYW